MTRRDDAIEAAARRLDPDAWDDLRPPGRLPIFAYAEARTLSEIWADRRNHARKEAAAILDAALAVLQPVILNTTEALDKLPAGAVLRSNEPRAEIAEGFDGLWLVTGMGRAAIGSDALRLFNNMDSWTVIWWGDGSDNNISMD